MKTIARFQIDYYQYLNEESQLVQNAPIFSQDIQHLKELYRLMVLSRTFDTKAIALQRTGKIGTYPSIRGQEAVFVGIGAALEENDIYVPYYRDAPTLMQRHVKLSDILLYWGGDERGNAFASQKNFPYSVPIATQTLHAAGAATALKIRNIQQAVLTVCGDGGTSEGDFYEALNIAGIWQLPIVFVINNNQWAISVPRSAQTAAETLAQKAIAAGIHGEQVDGNDVIAIQDRINVALEKARLHFQPSVIELVCYRHCDHTTADDASRYEPKHHREEAWIKEPITRLKKYLESIHQWDASQEEALKERCNQEIEAVVNEYLATPAPKTSQLFDNLYANLPGVYLNQQIMLEESQNG